MRSEKTKNGIRQGLVGHCETWAFIVVKYEATAECWAREWLCLNGITLSGCGRRLLVAGGWDRAKMEKWGLLGVGRLLLIVQVSDGSGLGQEEGISDERWLNSGYILNAAKRICRWIWRWGVWGKKGVKNMPRILAFVTGRMVLPVTKELEGGASLAGMCEDQ